MVRWGVAVRGGRLVEVQLHVERLGRGVAHVADHDGVVHRGAAGLGGEGGYHKVRVTDDRDGIVLVVVVLIELGHRVGGVQPDAQEVAPRLGRGGHGQRRRGEGVLGAALEVLRDRLGRQLRAAPGRLGGAEVEADREVRGKGVGVGGVGHGVLRREHRARLGGAASVGHRGGRHLDVRLSVERDLLVDLVV